MAHLSIGRAWSEGVRLVAREAGLLFPVALALIALPSVILQYLMPQSAPGAPAEPGAWMLLLLPVIIVSVIGTIALVLLMVRPGMTVGEAIAGAVRRLLPVLGAGILLGLAGGLLALPLIIAIGAALAAGGGYGLPVLIGFVTFLAFMFVAVRLSLMNVTGSIEPIGPIAIIRRSWALTSGHFWPLLGFVLVIAVVALIALFAISAVFGILFALTLGSPAENDLARLLTLIVGAIASTVFTVYFAAALTRIYAQLTGADEPVSVPASSGI